MTTPGTGAGHPPAAGPAREAPATAWSRAWAVVGAGAGLVSGLRSCWLGGAEAVRERERRGLWEGHRGRRAWAWIHGASVGEAEMAVALARGLLGRRPDLEAVVVTAATATGLDRARLRAAGEGRIELRAFPIDYEPFVERILRQGAPRLFVAVETELWPATLGAVQRAGVAAAVCNARMSAPSARRYRRAGGLFGPVLAGLSLVMARDEESAGRWVEAGARSAAVRVAGNLKFDLACSALSMRPRSVFSEVSLPPVLLAASTHAGEEAVVARAFAALGRGGVEARLLVAPRHPARAEAALAALEAEGLRAARLPEGSPPFAWPAGSDAVVVDRLGLLAEGYAAAAAALVGGSLVEGPGGHNLVEAAVAGVPVATGPFVANVADQVAVLRGAGALVTVHDAEELSRFWLEVIGRPAQFREASDRARAAVAASAGALDRTLDGLVQLLAIGPGARA